MVTKHTFTAIINAEDGEGIATNFLIHFECDSIKGMERAAAAAMNEFYGQGIFESWGAEIVAFIPGVVQAHIVSTANPIEQAAEDAFYDAMTGNNA